MTTPRKPSRSPWRKNIFGWPHAKLKAQGPKTVVLPAEDSPIYTNGHTPPMRPEAPGVAHDGPPELVLCFPSSVLDDRPDDALGFSPGRFCGFRTDAMEAAGRLYPHGVFPHHFRPRTSLLERDESAKQMVSCFVPWHALSGQVWTFRRGHTEGRLEGKLSCLPGGHVSSVDAWLAGPDDSHPDLLEVCYRAALRELGEEFNAWEENWKSHHSDIRLTLMGVVNDEETPVDRCHFGVIYRLDVAIPEKIELFSGIVGRDGCWSRVADLIEESDSMENWTRHVVRYLGETSPARSAP